MLKKPLNSSPFLTLEGFSLMETALVLIIIGLLSSLALKGYSLVEEARLQAVANQVEEIRTAYYLFQERYHSKPGDYEAGADLGAGLRNGNGNSIIEGDGLDPAQEAGNFWLHLQGANLISGIGSLPENGMNHFWPRRSKTKIGGGFSFSATSPEDDSEPWLILGAANGKTGDGSLLSPAQAENLDQKMDDGNPNTGKVRAKTGANSLKSCTQENRYLLATKEKPCILYFKLESL